MLRRQPRKLFGLRRSKSPGTGQCRTPQSSEIRTRNERRTLALTAGRQGFSVD